MGSKKNCVNIYYMSLLAVVFVIFFGSFSSSYAVDTSVQWWKDSIYLWKNSGVNVDSIDNSLLQQLVTEAADYDNIIFNKIYGITMYNGSGYITREWNHGLQWDWTSTEPGNLITYTMQFSNGNFVRYTKYENNDYPRIEIDQYLTPADIYTSSNLQVVQLEKNYNYPVLNSISLSATSHNKYEFTSYNQCHAEIIGYSIYDFDFWLQWYDEDNQIWGDHKFFVNDWDWAYTSIPGDTTHYYVFFPYLNTMPYGTYRYVADYNGSNAFSVVSNSFTIGYDDVNSSFTGNVDSNGNIAGTTNNGNVVDNIKDFMSGDVDFNSAYNSNDFDNAISDIDSHIISNPYNNFIFDFLEGFIASFTDDASDVEFKVHTWGIDRTVTVSDISPNYGSQMRTFLTTVSTVFWVLMIVKWVTQIIEFLSYANTSEAISFTDEKLSNLF